MSVKSKNSLRRHEDETSREARLKRDAILIWVTPDSTIIVIPFCNSALYSHKCNCVTSKLIIGLTFSLFC